MVEVATQHDTYTADFEQREKAAAGGALAWLLPVRKAAIARFSELGFPTTREEDWKYTSVAAIANTAFRRAEPKDVAAASLEPVTSWDPGCPRLVFVNGRHAPDLSSVDALPDGVRVTSLADADGAVLEAHLTRHVDFQSDAFTALNTAFLEDGALVHVAKGKAFETPIHLVFVSAANGAPTVSHPRVLIVADPTSQVTVVESYFGVAGEDCFTNGVTEIVAGESAVVDHYRVQRESERTRQISTLQVHQYHSSNVASSTVTLGGALVRNNINAVLDAEGCDCTLNGLYVLDGAQHVDNHLRVEHVKPHCDSREFFKGVLDDKARGVFSGRIFVHEDAQKTDAKQTNMNLLLSEDAQIDTKPQLEIFADDVKCTHGATIGQVDDDAIFYLCSRGINREAARSLLVFAFANEALERIRVEPLQEQLKSLLFARLPHGDLLRENT